MTATKSLRQLLEDTITADPDDLAAHSAYADFLMEQGNSRDTERGEFIRVQLALEEESRQHDDRKVLQGREAELLNKRQREWLGNLAPYLLDNKAMGEYVESSYGFDHVADFQFRRGWLDRLAINALSLELARALKRSPQTALLRDLAIETIEGRGYPEHLLPEDQIPENEHSVGLYPLIGASGLGNIRKFRLGLEAGDNYESYRCHEHTSAVVPIVERMPKLEVLQIYVNAFNLNALFSLPIFLNLRELTVYHGTQVHRLQLIAERSTYRNLTHLFIHPHNAYAWGENRAFDEPDGYRREDGYLPLSVVRPLLHSQNLPKLTHLRLRCSSMGDAGCQEIVESGILKRLKYLDLRHGCITDEGVWILTDCTDLLNLEWLDLDRNALTQIGVRRLKSLGLPIRVDDQQSDEQVDDREYLREGEFE